eukprot:SAG31_NODE_4284_length_3381_cov_1.864717_1_plen_160_part_00
MHKDTNFTTKWTRRASPPWPRDGVRGTQIRFRDVQWTLGRSGLGQGRGALNATRASWRRPCCGRRSEQRKTWLAATSALVVPNFHATEANEKMISSEKSAGVLNLVFKYLRTVLPRSQFSTKFRYYYGYSCNRVPAATRYSYSIQGLKNLISSYFKCTL